MRVVNESTDVINLQSLREKLQEGRGILVWLTTTSSPPNLAFIKQRPDDTYWTITPYYDAGPCDEMLVSMNDLNALMGFLSRVITMNGHELHWFPDIAAFLKWHQTLGKEANDA